MLALEDTRTQKISVSSWVYFWVENTIFAKAKCMESLGIRREGGLREGVLFGGSVIHTGQE